MRKLFKYEIEDELSNLKDIDNHLIMKYTRRLYKKYNKIIIFKNKGMDNCAYYCTYCKKWHFLKRNMLSKLKRGDYMTCGSCRNRLQVIYSTNVIDDIRTYLTYLELNSRKELIIRIFFYSKIYNKKYGDFDEVVYEVERMNVDRSIEMKNHSRKVMGYYGCIYHYGYVDKWERDRTQFYSYYPMNKFLNRPFEIRAIMKKYEKLKYSCLDIAVKHNIDAYSYCKLYVNYPKVEMLMKLGCTKVIENICSYSYYQCSQSILGKIGKDEINMLKKHNLSYKELDMYIETKIDEYELLKKAIEVDFSMKGFIKNKVKLIEYLYEHNYSKRDYDDYTRWANELGYDMNRNSLLYPDDPKKAHDDMLKRKTEYENTVYSEDINKYSKELEKYIFKNKGFIIRPASTQKELIDESKYLNHCVRTYAKKMANRECAIMFIRKSNENDVPFVTLELNSDKVIQCRSKNNKRPTDDVISFVNYWCRKFKLSSCFD